MKKCKTCGIEKPFSEFTLASNQASGLSPHCRDCSKKRLDTGIGHFGENEELLRAAIVYLRMHEATPKRQPEFISPKPAKKLKHWLDRLP